MPKPLMEHPCDRNAIWIWLEAGLHLLCVHPNLPQTAAWAFAHTQCWLLEALEGANVLAVLAWQDAVDKQMQVT